jgi:hypothetical protein
MSLNEKQRRMVEDHQRDQDNGEPLLSPTVTVQGAGYQGDTPYVTPTQAGAEVTGLEPGVEAEVEVFEDRVVIRRADE